MSWNEVLFLLWVVSVIGGIVILMCATDGAFYRGYKQGCEWAARGKDSHIQQMQSAIDELHKHNEISREYGDRWKARADARWKDVDNMLTAWCEEENTTEMH